MLESLQDGGKIVTWTLENLARSGESLKYIPIVRNDRSPLHYSDWV